MLEDKSKYIEHINEDEQKLVIRKILDKIERVLDYHTIEYSDFLDPYQRRLCQSVLNRFFDISYHDEGGYEDAERKSIVIYPKYIDKLSIEKPISAVRIDGKFKFTKINHRDYLGAIMSLGIKRDKLGDIIVHETYGQLVLHKDVQNYILLNLKNIGKESVSLSTIDLDEVRKGIEKYKDVYITVASLRLDKIISSVYNISRTISGTNIKNGKVKVNWQPIYQSSYILNEGDMISFIGKGRLRIHEVLGKSKKDRIKVILRMIL